MLATSLQVVLSGLAVGGIYALIALSFSITFTTTKTLTFAQGVFIGIGAFLGVASLAMHQINHGFDQLADGVVLRQILRPAA